MGCSAWDDDDDETVQFNCVKKKTRKTELTVRWESTGFLAGLSGFFGEFC
jgi:hypothetical protein